MVSSEQLASSKMAQPPVGSAPLLQVQDLIVKYGTQTAVSGISFEVRRGEFVALLGPSGCGKTTTLRAIAGLERATSGQIVIDRVLVADDENHVPPERRDINMVFQSYGIWPHMTVFDNVAYGLKRRRDLRREDVRDRVMEMLETVGLSDLARRYGTELSGGQQQRVALARALVTRSKLILYDEPLSNLDSGLRGIVRNQIVELHKAFHTTSIYVTHDQSEALSMADRILVMNDGRIEEQGVPRDIYGRPNSNFVAGFVGVMNIAPAVSLDVAPDRNSVLVRLIEHPTVQFNMRRAPRMPSRLGEEGHVFFRPEAVGLCTGSELRSDANCFSGVVERAMFVGPQVECDMSLDGWVVHMVLPGDAEVCPGDELTISVDPAKLVWLPKLAT